MCKKQEINQLLKERKIKPIDLVNEAFERIEKDEYILFTFRGEKSILYLYSNTRGKMKKYIIQYRRFIYGTRNYYCSSCYHRTDRYY